MNPVAARPEPGPARPYAFPAVVRTHAGAGRVVAAHLPGQRLATAALLLDAGAAAEPPGCEGVASVLAVALEEGTARRDKAGYALALERLGAELGTAVDLDAFRVAVSVPAEVLPAAVELLAEAVRTPRLDPADVARVRDDEASALRLEWAGPGPRADAALRAALFGPDSRYGRPPYGTPASVAGLDPADVAAFHAAHLRRPGVLLLAGDLDRLDPAALGAAVFDGTAGGPLPAGDPLPAAVPDARSVLLVDRPGAVQTTLRLGHRAPPRAHPDHVPLTLAATVLGGAFTSRLNHLLREVRGYTYGVRSDLVTTRRSGRFGVRAAVHTAATVAALTDTVAELTRLRDGGVSAAELAVAGRWRAGQLSVEMQTPGQIAAALATLVVHDLPDDHHATLRRRLLEATVDEVSAAAAAHLHPDGLTLVVEGDAAAYREELAGAGLGAVGTVEP